MLRRQKTSLPPILPVSLKSIDATISFLRRNNTVYRGKGINSVGIGKLRGSQTVCPFGSEHAVLATPEGAGAGALLAARQVRHQDGGLIKSMPTFSLEKAKWLLCGLPKIEHQCFERLQPARFSIDVDIVLESEKVAQHCLPKFVQSPCWPGSARRPSFKDLRVQRSSADRD